MLACEVQPSSCEKNTYTCMLEGNLEATRELLCAPGIDVEARDEQVSNTTKL